MSSGVPQPTPKKYPISPMGARIRKDVNYIRHYTPEHRAILENGDLIRVEPYSDFGHYLVRINTMPEILPLKTVNIATRWTATIPALPLTNSPSPVDALVRAFDLGRAELGHYRFFALDPGFQFLIAQPTAKFKFNDKAGARRMSWGTTTYHLVKGEYGGLPECFVFQDVTPIQFEVTSTNMNEASYWARIGALGFKYTLLRVKVPDKRNEPREVMTLNLGEKQ